jgi:hypothetical protein
MVPPNNTDTSEEVGGLSGEGTDGAPFSGVGTSPISSEATAQQINAARTAASDPPIENDSIGQSIPGVLIHTVFEGAVGASAAIIGEIVVAKVEDSNRGDDPDNDVPWIDPFDAGIANQKIDGGVITSGQDNNSSGGQDNNSSGGQDNNSDPSNP